MQRFSLVAACLRDRRGPALLPVTFPAIPFVSPCVPCKFPLGSIYTTFVPSRAEQEEQSK
jgi:hypothetical protein